MTWLLTGEGIEIGGGAGLMTLVRVGMTTQQGDGRTDHMSQERWVGGEWIDTI